MVDNRGSDIDGYMLATSTGTEKRKRGRPRKNPVLANKVAGGAGIAQAADHRPYGIAGIDEGELSRDYPWPGLASRLAARPQAEDGPAGPAVMRKRGRPRKVPVPEFGAVAGPVGFPALEACAGSGDVGQAVATVPRRPGRPRKAPLEASAAIGMLEGGEGAGIAGQAVAPVGRRPGRPRKAPLAASEAIGGPEGVEGVRMGKAELDRPEKPGEAGCNLVDRFGIGPGNDEGIGFWPPRPEEIEAVRMAAVAAGLVWGKKRGPKPKAREGPAGAPAPGIVRASGKAPDGDTPFI